MQAWLLLLLRAFSCKCPGHSESPQPWAKDPLEKRIQATYDNQIVLLSLCWTGEDIRFTLFLSALRQAWCLAISHLIYSLEIKSIYSLALISRMTELASSFSMAFSTRLALFSNPRSLLFLKCGRRQICCFGRRLELQIYLCQFQWGTHHRVPEVSDD